ncbi:MAG: protein translocase subunit SecF [Defluviitaleaceae bacterium]|nr:protein translocase subunit SecF [Defluviitaleaceae bacterium]
MTFNIKIIENRKKYFMISAIVIAVGVLGMIVNIAMGNGAFNLDVEFTGGTEITVDVTSDFEVADIESIVMEATGIVPSQLQRVTGTNQVSIRMHELAVEQRSALIEAMVAAYGLNAEEDISMSDVSATISGEMQRSAIIAIISACVAMLLYIAVRFRDFKIGMSMIISSVHDVIIVLLCYSILQISLSYSFIAAMLTVVGFSINATIIIFDRFRENKRLTAERMKENLMMSRKSIKEPTVEEQLDLSINQTLLRCAYTALFVLVVTLCLYVLGVPAIRDFILPIIVATICGTYSSIFIAGPIYYMMNQREAAKAAEA